MATLTTTVIEQLTLNGTQRGSTNVISTDGINDVTERVVSCTQGQLTTIGVFGTSNQSSAGAIDVENTKYIRVTNLSTTDTIYLGISCVTNICPQVSIRPGGSFIIFAGEDALATAIDGETSVPTFNAFKDISTLIVKPAASTDCQVELFVALT